MVLKYIYVKVTIILWKYHYQVIYIIVPTNHKQLKIVSNISRVYKTAKYTKANLLHVTKLY